MHCRCRCTRSSAQSAAAAFTSRYVSGNLAQSPWKWMKWFHSHYFADVHVLFRFRGKREGEGPSLEQKPGVPSENETEKPQALQLAEVLEANSVFPGKPVKRKKGMLSPYPYPPSQFLKLYDLIFHRLKMIHWITDPKVFSASWEPWLVSITASLLKGKCKRTRQWLLPEQGQEPLFKAFQDCAGSSLASFFCEGDCDELGCEGTVMPGWLCGC